MSAEFGVVPAWTEDRASPLEDAFADALTVDTFAGKPFHIIRAVIMPTINLILFFLSNMIPPKSASQETIPIFLSAATMA